MIRMWVMMGRVDRILVGSHLSRSLGDVSKVGIVIVYVVEMIVLRTSLLYSEEMDLMEGEGMVSTVIGGGGVKERRWGILIGDTKCIFGLLWWFSIDVYIAIGRVEWRVVMVVVFELCSGFLFLLSISIKFCITSDVAML